MGRVHPREGPAQFGKAGETVFDGMPASELRREDRVYIVYSEQAQSADLVNAPGEDHPSGPVAEGGPLAA